LGVRLAVAFLAVIAVGVGTVALVAGRSGAEEFRSYVAARGYGPDGRGPGAGDGMMAGRGAMMTGQPMPPHVAPEDWLVARRLTQPARALQQASRRMAGGDLEARVHIRTGDELEEVGQAFNQMAESLQRQERARRALVADVAHDLRTPVAVIQGTVDAMLDGVYEPALEHLRSIREETERLGRLVGDLREVSLADAGQLQLDRAPVDVARLVANAAARAQRRAGPRAAVVTDIGAPLPAVTGDEARLVQAPDNLLDNALRYTPPGGTVTVAVTVATRPSRAATRPAPQRRAAPDGAPAVTITVQDSGPGIPPEHLPHVFERFYRGDDARSRAGGAGSGLGLAIVRGIVAAHGGEVRAENVGGGGARFSITLPVEWDGDGRAGLILPDVAA
jgi:two-component system OmpR family sensor kinase